EEIVMNYLQYASLPKGYEVTQKQVLALKQTFADLVLIHQSNTLSEFELLVMDKGANALAQQTLRELYTEELKKTKENEWLQKWFQEEHTERDILEHLEETEG
ncbi:PucR family transcriptional regulator, partial [Brevibacillus sp. SIMBA_076]